jgi:CheY-like chemotaxis protein
VELIRFAAEEKGLRLAWSVDPGVPREVRGDPGRIRQILLNLLGNGVKFTQSGSVELSVECVSEPGGAAVLRFVVADTGIGIAADAQARLFQSFVQADASMTRRFGGTGLGLAISRRLAELHGGAVGVDSEPGRGSRFWFTVAVQAAEAGGQEVRATAEVRSVRDTAPGDTTISLSQQVHARRVLVVEDNAVNQKVAGSLLRKLGHRVDFVANGHEAVEAVQAIPYDLILMDCQMPEMDGYEATRAIRELSGIASRVPIIALTANAMAGDRERCVAAGMDDYLPKPLRFEDLSAAVERWLQVDWKRAA